MCGIAGFVGKKPIPEDRITQTLNLMRNRGPDHQAHIHFQDSGQEVYLLHSRLSIIDLHDRANQPLQIGDDTIVFNGEIYNHVELRNRMPNVAWQTEVDTESLLRSYQLHGEACLDLLEGMWAFAIYDLRRSCLVLSRDRFGEKPLYYWITEEGLYFGSEIKFIRALSGRSLPINYRQLCRHLVNGYKSLYKGDELFYENVKALPAASVGHWTPDGKWTVKSYWQPQFAPVAMTRESAVEEFRERLLASIKLRLRADVPIAFCLSGGLDSATLVCAASRIFNYDVATFSLIDSDKRYNEEPNIRATIDWLDCRHTLIPVNRDAAWARLERLVAYHDAPVSTISYFIHSQLSEAIRDQGYRVVCSGTAADELVTGYYDHFNLHLYMMRDHATFPELLDAWQKHIGTIVRNPYLQNPMLYMENPGQREHVYLDHEKFAGFLHTDFYEAFTEHPYTDNLLRNRMLNEMFHEVIPIILHEDDLNSMMHSVENRSPYLDRDLFEFCYTIPDEHLIRDGYGKDVLRQATTGIVPDSVRLDRQKKGFNASLNSLFDLQAPETRDQILADDPVFDLVRRDKIAELLSLDPLPNSLSKFLFYFLNVKLFMQMHRGG